MSTRSITHWGMLMLIGTLGAFAGCATVEPTTTANTPETLLAREVALAHGVRAWDDRQVLKSDIAISFGGNPILEGTMWFHVHDGRSRLELTDGTVLVFDGEDAWISPGDAEAPRARFHLLTWPYFVAAPMKLGDPGVNLQMLEPQLVRNTIYQAMHMTFASGTGDTPDDWYIAYINPVNNQLAAMAYIVTYGTPQSEAEQEPHAITYDNYIDVEGVQIADETTFWLWSRDRRIHGDPIGSYTLNNVQFVAETPEIFSKPPDAKEDELPAMEQ